MTIEHVAVPVTGAHEKTIDLRVERLEKAVALASGIWLGEVASGPDFIGRVLATLIENRAFVRSHITTTIDHIVRTVAADEQDARITAELADVHHLIERADVAIARIRVVIEHTEC